MRGGWIVALACMLAGAARAEEFRLEYRLSPMIEREVGWPGGVTVELAATAPWPAERNPPGLSPRAAFGRVFNDRMLALDARPDAAGYGFLWVDVNGDGALDAGERFEITRGGLPGGGIMVPIEFPAPDGPLREHFAFIPTAVSEKPKVAVHNSGYWQGRVKLGEKTCRLLLVDANANGAFNDMAGEDAPGDVALLDLDGNGRFDVRAGSPEVIPLAKCLRADGQFWSLLPSADGSLVRVERVQVTVGALQTRDAAVTLTVAGAAGTFTFQRDEGQAPFVLPVGSYRIRQVSIDRPDDKGQTWNLRSTDGAGPRLEVQEGRETLLPLGAPLAGAVAATTHEDAVTLELAFTGVDGLTYSLFPRRPLAVEPPQVTLRVKGGDWQKKAAFAPGRDRAWHAVIEEPNVHGPVQATPEFPGIPFEVQWKTTEVKLP